MKKILHKLGLKILRFEHLIYCLSGGRIELPMHEGYYNAAKEKYECYLAKKLDEARLNPTRPC